MSLNLYKPLGDNDEVVRLSAANKLASELLALLEGEHTVKTKSDVDYALSRLTKGLSSGRESARPGFAVVLTEVGYYAKLSPEWGGKLIELSVRCKLRNGIANMASRRPI